MKEIISKIDEEIELAIDRSLDFSSPGACIFISGLERAKEIIQREGDKTNMKLEEVRG